MKQLVVFFEKTGFENLPEEVEKNKTQFDQLRTKLETIKLELEEKNNELEEKINKLEEKNKELEKEIPGLEAEIKEVNENLNSPSKPNQIDMSIYKLGLESKYQTIQTEKYESMGDKEKLNKQKAEINEALKYFNRVFPKQQTEI